MADGKDDPGEAEGDLVFKHEEVVLLVSRAWDGELSPAEAGWLEQHLKECPECARSATKFLAFLTRLEPYLERELRRLDE